MLRVLKSDAIKEVDKKKTANSLLGVKLSDERFAVMINLSKKLTDFNPVDEDVRDNVMFIYYTFIFFAKKEIKLYIFRWMNLMKNQYPFNLTMMKKMTKEMLPMKLKYFFLLVFLFLFKPF